ncbi:MAG: AAC(3) family N-acetyltransferase [Gammaproteobacteria bacterium]|nr:AAC(3) family N-acetyltransferase [Gammaproteobacteria bacterium]
MVHSSWLPFSGFAGTPADMVEGLRRAVTSDGLIVMPSMTYHNQSSREFLEGEGVMKVRRSPSRMGLLTEVFRRSAGVRRSLSPTHPLLAWGDRAEWFLAGHEDALEPFGASSPFARLLELDAKILCVDAPFSTITYTHFLEDRIAETLPFPLYEPEPLAGTVLDYEGQEREVPVKVLNRVANQMRREERLVKELDERGVIQRARVGNTRLLLVGARAMADAVDEMTAQGRGFFDAPVGPAREARDGR